MRRANFRNQKTLDGFNLDRLLGFNRAAVHDLATCRFIDERVAVLIAGPCARGKSHVAQSLERAAARRLANLCCKADRPDIIYNHMVVSKNESEESLNQLFRALADGTRRDILARSLVETPSVSDLAARYDMSFAAVQKHVAVLERAGLVQKRANGREQLVSTDHARIQRAGELLEHYESIWRQRLAQLDDVLLPKGK